MQVATKEEVKQLLEEYMVKDVNEKLDSSNDIGFQKRGNEDIREKLKEAVRFKDEHIRTLKEKVEELRKKAGSTKDRDEGMDKIVERLKKELKGKTEQMKSQRQMIREEYKKEIETLKHQLLMMKNNFLGKEVQHQKKIEELKMELVEKENEDNKENETLEEFLSRVNFSHCYNKMKKDHFVLDDLKFLENDLELKKYVKIASQRKRLFAEIQKKFSIADELVC